MKYTILNYAIGVYAAALGILLGEWALLLCWPALNFLLLGMAYVTQSANIFGKRADGSLPWWSWLVFLPLHLLTLGCWHVLRLFSREPAFARVNDQLLVGRRLLARELPPCEMTVLDLTAEFAEPIGIIRAAEYRSFPILDTAAPDAAALRRLLQDLPENKPLYIHCAQGHGRTGLVAAAWLISRGYAADAAAALAMLQSVRPGIRLKTAQQRLLGEVFGAGGSGAVAVRV